MDVIMILEARCSKRDCIHYLGVHYTDVAIGEASEAHFCDAFSKVIPGEISFGSNNHLSPFPGDNGIQYERADKDKGT